MDGYPQKQVGVISDTTPVLGTIYWAFKVPQDKLFVMDGVWCYMSAGTSPQMLLEISVDGTWYILGLYVSTHNTAFSNYHEFPIFIDESYDLRFRLAGTVAPTNLIILWNYRLIPKVEN